jgi:hypothetical protein
VIPWLAATGGDRRQHVRGMKRLYRSCEKNMLTSMVYLYVGILDFGFRFGHGLDNIGWVCLSLEGRCSTGASLFSK